MCGVWIAQIHFFTWVKHLAVTRSSGVCPLGEHSTTVFSQLCNGGVQPVVWERAQEILHWCRWYEIMCITYLLQAIRFRLAPKQSSWQNVTYLIRGNPWLHYLPLSLPLPHYPSSPPAQTFISFLLEVDSVYEVHDYIKSYLGETDEAHEFAKSFLDRRQKIKSTNNLPPASQVRIMIISNLALSLLCIIINNYVHR